MPIIGRPSELPNPFKKVSKYDGPDRNEKVNNAKNTGSNKTFDQELLEKITGKKSSEKDIKFVDRKVHNRMGKDEFLKLLSHQMQNQDPMNPMQQDKFVGELAQFAQLEQMTQMNTSLGAMKESELPKGKFYAASLLGKKVVTDGTSIQLKKSGETAEIPFNLDKNAKKMVLRILDDKGNMISQMEQYNLSKGSHSLKWDGIAMDGGRASKGDYSVAVYAWDEEYRPIHVEMKSVGTVSSVSFDNGEAILNVNGKKVFLRDVRSFHMSNENLEANSGVGNDNKH